jgi:hypothetical protein
MPGAATPAHRRSREVQVFMRHKVDAPVPVRSCFSSARSDDARARIGILIDIGAKDRVVRRKE